MLCIFLKRYFKLLLFNIAVPALYVIVLVLAAEASDDGRLSNQPDHIGAPGSSQLAKPDNETVSDPAVALNQSKEMIGKGRYREALSVLAPFVSEPSKYPRAVADYISILVWEGSRDEAISMYEKLPPSFPQYPYLSRNIARAYYDNKDYSKAYSLYQRSLEQSPSDEEAQKGVVLSLAGMGNIKNAYDRLNQFLSANRASLSLELIKVSLLFKQDRYIEAFELYRKLLERSGVDKEYIYRTRDDLLNDLSDEKRKAALVSLQSAVQAGDTAAVKDYILLLIINRDYTVAVKTFEDSGLDIAGLPEHLLSWIAWSYFKTDNAETAELIYRKVLDRRQDYFTAKIGLSYCLAKEGLHDRAFDILDDLMRNHPQDLEVRFARAYAFERSNRFWDAINEYDRILEIKPANMMTSRLRLLAFSDLGMNSYAYERAVNDFPSDLRLHESIKGNMAADLIVWKEYTAAIDRLQPQLGDDKNLRARYDYIVALIENKDMKKAIDVYEDLTAAGVTPPAWVLERVADAYLYIERPYKALDLYNAILKEYPKSFSARFGKFYVLQEIREWDDARLTLNELDNDAPLFLKRGYEPHPNRPRLTLLLQRDGFLHMKTDWEMRSSTLEIFVKGRLPTRVFEQDRLTYICGAVGRASL